MMFRPVSLQEANTFLPLVRERFAIIHTFIAEGQSIYEQLASPGEKGLPSGTVQADGLQELVEAPITPQTKERKAKKKRLQEIESLVRNEVIQLNHFGAIIKSVYPARVAFLSERHRQPVYLAWQMGDKNIAHWYCADEGFSMRRPITEPLAFGDMVIH